MQSRPFRFQDPVLLAVNNDDMDSLKNLLSESFFRNLFEAFNTACNGGKLEIVKLFLEDDNFIKKCDLCVPFSNACVAGQFEVVRTLWEFFTIPQESVDYDNFILHVALVGCLSPRPRVGHLQILEFILRQEIPSIVKTDILMKFNSQNSASLLNSSVMLKQVELFFAEGTIDLSEKKNLLTKIESKNLCILLNLAVQKGHFESIKFLSGEERLEKALIKKSLRLCFEVTQSNLSKNLFCLIGISQGKVNKRPAEDSLEDSIQPKRFKLTTEVENSEEPQLTHMRP